MQREGKFTTPKPNLPVSSSGSRLEDFLMRVGSDGAESASDEEDDTAAKHPPKDGNEKHVPGSGPGRPQGRQGSFDQRNEGEPGRELPCLGEEKRQWAGLGQPKLSFRKMIEPSHEWRRDSGSGRS
jgi:hypothetical protein